MDLDRVGAFLEFLQSGPRGRALAANMLDSHTAGLYKTSTLRDFLLDCARTYETDKTGTLPLGNAVNMVEDVSCGRGAGKQSFLRHCQQPMFSLADTQRLSTTMKTEGFHRFLVAETYKEDTESVIPAVLPPVPVDSPSGMLEYKQRLAELTSHAGWQAPNATIGKPLPEPSNCWFTTDAFGPDPVGPSYSDDLATESRDELGLIHHKQASFLLRLSFAASSLAKLKPCELARPSFSDLGNSRFRVRQSSARAEEYYAAGCGATVHLGKFGDSAFGEATGVAERVSTSLPLSELDSFDVIFLGKVKGDRGTTKHDDDDAFAQYSEDGRTAEEIRSALLALVN